MRKWLFLLLGISVLYAVSRLNTPARRKRYPFFERLNRSLNILVWVLLTVYLASFGWWLYRQVVG